MPTEAALFCAEYLQRNFPDQTIEEIADNLDKAESETPGSAPQ